MPCYTPPLNDEDRKRMRRQSAEIDKMRERIKAEGITDTVNFNFPPSLREEKETHMPCNTDGMKAHMEHHNKLPPNKMETPLDYLRATIESLNNWTKVVERNEAAICAIMTSLENNETVTLNQDAKDWFETHKKNPRCEHYKKEQEDAVNEERLEDNEEHGEGVQVKKEG